MFLERENEVTLEIDGEHVCTLAEFIADNAEWMERGADAEVVAVLGLMVGEQTTIGGGAAAAVTIRRTR
jgi:hypothetical protein